MLEAFDFADREYFFLFWLGAQRGGEQKCQRKVEKTHELSIQNPEARIQKLHPLHSAERVRFRGHVRVLQLFPVVRDVDQFSADVVGLLGGQEQC
jgi:hypothetical protein